MFSITGKTNEVLAQGIMVMESVCVHCHQVIQPENGKFLAVGHPYQAALHWKCAPHFSFNGEWPHSKPSIAYTPTT